MGEEMAIYNLQAKVMKTALLTMLITTIAIPETYAAGRTANSIANTVLSGAGVPAKSLGINGDFYIDIKTMNMYGPKKNNSWPLPVSMRGPQGATGAAGSDGKNGTSGAVSAGTAGTAGPQGPAGPAGAKGETGATDHKDQQVLTLELQDLLGQKVTLVQLVRKVLREIRELQGHSILIMEHLPLEV
jgi:hypothetical protein